MHQSLIGLNKLTPFGRKTTSISVKKTKYIEKNTPLSVTLTKTTPIHTLTDYRRMDVYSILACVGHLFIA